jgi:hypothetical protein
MGSTLPKGLNTVGTILAEIAIGSIPLLWWFFPPTSGMGFLIAPAIALGAFFIVFILIGLVWPKRRSPGQCQQCGYDLRATPGRCPECGAVADKHPVGDAR